MIFHGPWLAFIDLVHLWTCIRHLVRHLYWLYCTCDPFLFGNKFKVILDLEEERQRHAQDTAEGDDVTYMLEKERERLTQQVSRVE